MKVLLVDLLEALESEQVEVEKWLVLDESAQILTLHNGLVRRLNARRDDCHLEFESVNDEWG